MILRQALRFAGVGVLGFFVDAGVFTLAHSAAGLDLYSSRGLSYVAAVTSTWALNRTFTFKEHASSSMLREWARFCAANTVGGAVNLGVYAGLVHYVQMFHDVPVAGVAIGSLSGLFVNFTLSRIYVFRAHIVRPVS